MGLLNGEDNQLMRAVQCLQDGVAAGTGVKRSAA